MSDSAVLFLILAAIYLSECCAWARRGVVAFLAPLGRRARPARPSTALGNARGGLVFGNPLPPLGFLALCEPWPVALSPGGVCAGDGGAASAGAAGAGASGEAFLRFDQIAGAEAPGNDLLVNGRLVARLGSERAARALAGLVREAASLPPREREEKLRGALEASLDPEKVSGRLDAYRRRTRSLRVLCNALFVHLFALAPAAVLAHGLARWWIPLLLGALALAAAIVVVFRRAHLALYADGAGERRLHMLVMLLSPPAAVRAHDALARDLLAGFHPLAAAAVLCPPGPFVDLARRALLDARRPPREEDSGDERAARAWYGERLRDSLERLVRGTGARLEDVLAPPARRDAQARSYCPRCHCQYLAPSGECPDCGGLQLQPL